MRQRRGRPGATALITVLWGALLLGWLQLTPLYRAADEPTHTDLVLRLRDGGSYADPGTLDVSARVRASFPLANLSTAERPELADQFPLPFDSTDVPARDPSYDELPAPQDLPPYANQMTQHPPLYYLLLAAESRLLPGFGGWSFPVQLGALRLLSALLLLPLPALAAAAARRLGAAPAVATAAALLPLAVPQLAHVGASVNNDVLLVLLGAAVAVPLLGVGRGNVSRGTAVVVGVLLGLALLTKAWAVGLLAWAGLAYLLALLGPARAERGRAVVSGLLAAGVAMLVGGWWWVANVVRFGVLQPQGLPAASFPPRETDPDAVEFVLGALRRLAASTWGNFGWLQVQIAEPVRVAAAVVVTLALVLAVARRLDLPWARPSAAVALGAFCVQFAVVLQQSLKNYLRGGYFAGLQGRYLYGFVGVVAALVAIGLSRVVPRRALPLVALGAVVVLQALGALTALIGFWWPDGEGLRRALAVQAAWAPFPRLVTLLAVAVAGVCVVLLAARLARRPSAPPGPSPSRPRRGAAAPCQDRPVSRIAVATADPLTPRMAGPAIRAWQIAAALAQDHDVRLVTTSECSLTSPDMDVRHLSGPVAARELEAWCDVLFFQGNALRDIALQATEKVVVVDLYDPFHLEQLERSRAHGPDRRRLGLENAVAEANQQCLRGDFLVCASEKQRDFWLGHLAALGRLNPVSYDDDPTLRSLVDVVPFGIPAEPPQSAGPVLKGVVDGVGPHDKVVLWGGGIYNWFDPLTLIRAVDLLRGRRDDVRLFFLGMQHPHPDVPEMRMATRARALSAELGLTGRCVFFNEQWVAYDERGRYLLEADVGVSTHLDHVETAYSFRTRMLDYLWAGLPMVSTRGDVFARLIDEHGLGLTVEPGDVDGLADALERLLDDDALAGQCRAGLAALAPSFHWDRVLEPLLAFCRAPRRAPDLVDEDARRRLASGVGRLYRQRSGLRRELDIAADHLRSGGVRLLAAKAVSRVAYATGRKQPPAAEG